MAGYMATSKTVEWNTPKNLFKQLDDEFHFTLDPCCTHENALCENHYTKEDDGLKHSWGGQIVYCNPPYGREIADWIKKGAESGTLCVFLVPARTDTKWFHDYCYRKPNVEIRFIRGRVHYNDGKGGAPFASMIVIFRGDNAQKRIAEYSEQLTMPY